MRALLNWPRSLLTSDGRLAEGRALGPNSVRRRRASSRVSPAAAAIAHSGAVLVPQAGLCERAWWAPRGAQGAEGPPNLRSAQCGPHTLRESAVTTRCRGNREPGRRRSLGMPLATLRATARRFKACSQTPEGTDYESQGS